MKWLRDNLQIIKNVSDSSDLAQAADPRGEVSFVPAFSGLYAPYWRKDARRYLVNSKTVRGLESTKNEFSVLYAD